MTIFAHGIIQKKKKKKFLSKFFHPFKKNLISGRSYLGRGFKTWFSHPEKSSHFSLRSRNVYISPSLLTFCPLGKMKNFCRSQMEIYIRFVRREPKTILLDVIVISSLPEIEQKWREEGGKERAPRCAHQISPGSQDSPLSPASETSLTPQMRK